MKAAAIAITLCILFNTVQEAESLEKKALSLVQRTPASDLDPSLPNVSLNIWFNQVVGPRAGIVWQLSECGEANTEPDIDRPDLLACMQANAILSNGCKVVLAILVGTFKKGLAEKASFKFGIIDYEEHLRTAKKLSDLPRLLSPRQLSGNYPVELPEILSDRKQIKWLPQTFPQSLLPIDKDILKANIDPDQSSYQPEDVPPPPPTQSTSSQDSSNQTQSIQQVTEKILVGGAITKVEAVYPPTARMLKAFGTVKVQITISETGRVIEARAISGHQALRSAAVEAALKWVFKPTTLNGAPIRVQGVLSFTFTSKM